MYTSAIYVSYIYDLYLSVYHVMSVTFSEIRMTNHIRRSYHNDQSIIACHGIITLFSATQATFWLTYSTIYA